MRRLIIILSIILLIAPVFGGTPAKYVDCDISVEIQENRIIKEKINLTFPTSVDKFNYYIIHPVTNLKVFAPIEIECEVHYERAGTLISCQNFNSSEILISFNCLGLITQYKDSYVFSDRYIISTPADDFKLRVYLPKGYILSEQKLKEIEHPPYFPIDGVQKTDGRTIYLEWNRKPKLGEVYDVSIFYEKALRSDQFAVVVFAIIVVLAMILLFFIFRKKPGIPDYGLRGDEKKILDVLSRENKISQRKICKETGMSKAHVSRIAKSLEERGLIERKRKGRSYEIVLKRE